MSEINLKRFVDIDIQPHVTLAASGVRDTVVLFTADGVENASNLFTSMTEVDSYIESLSPGVGYDTTRAYLQVYFNNGGIKALVKEGVSYSNLTASMIKALDNQYIYIAYAASNSTREACYNAMKTLAQTLNADSTVYGISEKILLASTNVASDEDSVKNFAVKYSSQVGAEMTIAAYLSKTNIDGLDTINDYAFTEENITLDIIDDTTYGTVINNNMNVDITLANSTRNCGGNCKDGSDLINEFVRIVLHQTLTEQLTSLLTQKLKSTTGISKMYTVITQELERYRNAGYLTTDKVWTDSDLTVTRNQVTYTIISKGDALINGYHVKILPTSALTTQDKTAHNTPPIYIIIADQYSIRKITINGEVI